MPVHTLLCCTQVMERFAREQARLARHATASGAAKDGNGLPIAPPRRGVLPGSFLDLMMQATDKTTGNRFSDFEIANQACHSCRVGCTALPVTCGKVLARSLKRLSVCVLQAYAMMMAGYESTANALAFTLYLLALNKDKEARLIAEVDAFGSMDTPCYGDMARHADALAAGPSELAHSNATSQPTAFKRQAVWFALCTACAVDSESRHRVTIMWRAVFLTSRRR